jgi:H+/gluconate symporter-like permease
MRVILVPVALALAVTVVFLSPTPVPAAGCLKGAVVGGVAGHYAGHHGLLGAGAGCLIGRHEANKHARERAEQERSNDGRY